MAEYAKRLGKTAYRPGGWRSSVTLSFCSLFYDSGADSFCTPVALRLGSPSQSDVVVYTLFSNICVCGSIFSFAVLSLQHRFSAVCDSLSTLMACMQSIRRRQQQLLRDSLSHISHSEPMMFACGGGGGVRTSAQQTSKLYKIVFCMDTIFSLSRLPSSRRHSSSFSCAHFIFILKSIYCKPLVVSVFPMSRARSYR